MHMHFMCIICALQHAHTMHLNLYVLNVHNGMYMSCTYRLCAYNVHTDMHLQCTQIYVHLMCIMIYILNVHQNIHIECTFFNMYKLLTFLCTSECTCSNAHFMHIICAFVLVGQLIYPSLHIIIIMKYCEGENVYVGADCSPMRYTMPPLNYRRAFPMIGSK